MGIKWSFSSPADQTWGEMVIQPDGGPMNVPFWLSDEGTLQMVQEPSQMCKRAHVPASFAKPQTEL